MASIIPGTGGTLKSVTLENVLLEAAMLAQIAETNLAQNRDSVNNISVTFNADSANVSITADLQVSQVVDATGQLVLKAKEYLTDLVP